MSLPEDLMFLHSKMDGYARNCVQLNSHNAGTVQAGKTLSITLPRNSVIDLRTLRFYFECVTTNTNAAIFTRLPGDLHSLIRRLTVKVGGRTVMSVDEYATIYNILNVTRGGAMTKGKEALCHPYVYSTFDGMTGTDISAVAHEGVTGTVTKYCLDDFLSLTELQPPIIDTGLLPDIIVEFEFMPSDVLITSTTSALTVAVPGGTDNNPSYSVSNHYFTIDTLTWADYDSYRAMVNARIGNNNSIDLPFKRYEIYRGSHLGTSVFSVASGSINNVYAVFRNSTTYPNTYQALSQFFHDPANGVTNEQLLKARHFNFEPFGLTSYRWRVNNQAYPLYDATVETALKDIEHNMLEYVKPVERNFYTSTRHAFYNGNLVLPLKLNHDGNLALMSGADSRGTNSIIELTTKHTAALAACEVFMLVECSGVVKIGKNGQLAVDE